MNQNTLIGLIVAALIALIAAIALSKTNQPRSEGSAEVAEYLAPGLRDHLNDISKVVVTGASDKTLATLNRSATGWNVAEKGGYGADTGKLRELLLKLSDSKLLEKKTANKDKYAVLGVADVSSKDAKGVQLELDGLAQPMQLIVGNVDARGAGTFVRRAGDAQSWLASGALSIEKNPADWLNKDLIDIAANRIASVTITHADGKVVHIFKDASGDANFKLSDSPKGREAGEQYTINALAANLAGLRFDDVLPAKVTAPPASPLKARYAAFDGLVVDAVAWQQDGKDDAQFSASADAAQADKGIAPAQAKSKADYDAAVVAAEAASKNPNGAKVTDAPIKPLAVSDPAKDRANRMDALNRQVAELNARFNGWTFVLPAYKYAAMDKSIDDLLKPVETKAAAKSPIKAGAAPTPKKFPSSKRSGAEP